WGRFGRKFGADRGRAEGGRRMSGGWSAERPALPQIVLRTSRARRVPGGACHGRAGAHDWACAGAPGGGGTATRPEAGGQTGIAVFPGGGSVIGSGSSRGSSVAQRQR